MKRENGEWIMHGSFVDDMIHAFISEELKKKSIKEYKRDFEITREDIMASFLGMEVEKDEKSIKLHLDTHVQEILDEYTPTIKKLLKPKQVPMQPGVVLEHDDCPETPDPREQKIYRSFSARLHFAGAWVRRDISYPASQLARFCASAGPTHWAALHHLMGYLEAKPKPQAELQEKRGGAGSKVSRTLAGETVCVCVCVCLAARQMDLWHGAASASEISGDQSCGKPFRCQRHPREPEHPSQGGHGPGETRRSTRPSLLRESRRATCS